MTAVLEIRDLHKNFGGITVTNNVNLAVEAGEIRCLIGPNGAGKSTLISLITGRLTPTSGDILLDGSSIIRLRSYQRIACGIGVKFQVPTIFRGLTVEENLAVAVQKNRHEQTDSIELRVADLLDLCLLTGLGGVISGNLSHGQQQWLEIAMAVASSPKLLLLDEPTAGMSPEETRRTGDLVLALNHRGTTVLAVEHDMEFVRQIAQKITVLHQGSVFFEGTMGEVESSPSVADIYLGGRDD